MFFHKKTPFPHHYTLSLLENKALSFWDFGKIQLKKQLSENIIAFYDTAISSF